MPRAVRARISQVQAHRLVVGAGGSPFHCLLQRAFVPFFFGPHAFSFTRCFVVNLAPFRHHHPRTCCLTRCVLQRLGQCYFALAMMRDAEESLNNSIKLQVDDRRNVGSITVITIIITTSTTMSIGLLISSLCSLLFSADAVGVFPSCQGISNAKWFYIVRVSGFSFFCNS